MVDNDIADTSQPASLSGVNGGLALSSAGLFVVSFLWVLLCVWIVFLFSRRLSAFEEGTPEREQLTFYVLLMSIHAVYSVMLAVGAYRMVRGGSYVWSVAISVLAMVPYFSPFLVLGIPFGIWTFVVLVKPGIRESFPDMQRQGERAAQTLL